MSNRTKETAAAEPAGDHGSSLPRRALLRKLGRYAAVTPPAVTLLMAANSKRALAVSPAPGSSRQFKNSEGTVETAMLSSLFACGSGAGLDAIDGVGVCLAAIKALNARLDLVEGALRPAVI